ncbi:hypothetical protein KCP74_13915 [Salmonella enterica subsp. enterica]|nr:hypothetical protein KCP74_13915 [Salmonella enterica subsp. enterica]
MAYRLQPADAQIWRRILDRHDYPAVGLLCRDGTDCGEAISDNPAHAIGRGGGWLHRHDLSNFTMVLAANRASVWGCTYGRAAGVNVGFAALRRSAGRYMVLWGTGWFWMLLSKAYLLAGDIHLFWLDDTPQQARFLALEERTRLSRRRAKKGRVKACGCAA